MNKHEEFLRDMDEQLAIWSYSLDEKHYDNIEENVRIVVDLLEETKGKYYSEEQWKNLHEKAKNNFILQSAMLKSRYIPNKILNELVKDAPLTSLLQLTKCTDEVAEQIVKLADKKEIKDYFANGKVMEKHIISGEVVKKLGHLSCVELEKIQWFPAQFTKDSSFLYKRIQDILDGKSEIYKGFVPETLTSAVVNNDWIAHETREKAFEIGADINKVYKYTEKIRNDVFDSAYITLFNSGIKNEDLLVNAAYKINEMIKEHKLTSAQTIKFIKGYQENRIKMCDNTIRYLAVYSKYDDVINEIANCGEFCYKYLRENKKLSAHTCDKIMQHIERTSTSKEGKVKEFFIEKVFNSRMSDEYIEKMAKSKDDNVLRAMMLSEYVPQGIKVDIIYDKTIKSELKEELSYLKYINGRLMMLSSDWKAKQLKLILLRIILKDRPTDTTKWSNVSNKKLLETLKKKSYTDDINMQVALNNDEYKFLKEMIKDAKDYPTFINVSKEFKDKIDTIYDKSRIFDKFPELFYTKDYEIIKKIDDVKYTALSLADGGKRVSDKLIKQIQKENDRRNLLTIKEILLTSVYLNSFDNPENYLLYAYKFSDINHTLNEKIKEIEEKKLQKEEKELTNINDPTQIK